MMIAEKKVIGGSTSIFLDCIRITAALTVVLQHATMHWITAYPVALALMNNLAHAAVVVFFVLSGYLIAYTTLNNNRGRRQYAVARLSRLYSIVFPAILLTGIIQFFVARYDPALAEAYIRDKSWMRYLLSILFCNEAGWLSASPPINGPLWSLSYEFWYYAIFGLWFFKGSSWKSYLLPIIACLIAGPKILLLMPLWLAGFLAYYVRRPNLSVTGSWLVVTLLLLVTACGAVYLPEYPLNLGVKPFFYSNRFLTDYALGIFFSAALWCVPYYASNVSAGFVKRLRLVSDLSFPMYLLHFPLFIAWRLVFGRTENDVAQMLFATAVVITSTGIIGYILEKQKYEWVRFFNWLTSFTIVRMAIPKPKPRPTAQPIA